MKQLRKQGFFIVNHIQNEQNLLEFASSFGEIYQQQDDYTHHGFVKISRNSHMNKYAFTSHALFPHTDRSIMYNPPDLMLLWVKNKAQEGGSSLICDADQLFNNSINQFNFKALFSSENDAGLRSFNFYEPATRTFRFRHDNHIFVSYPNMHKYLTVKKIIAENTKRIKLNDRQCIVINNKRMLHGRTAFHGHRLLYRVLVYSAQKYSSLTSPPLYNYHHSAQQSLS